MHHPPCSSGTCLLGHGQLLMPNSQANRKILKHLSQQRVFIASHCQQNFYKFITAPHFCSFPTSLCFALSLRVSFTCSVNSALLLLCSLPYSVPLPTLPIPFPGFLFGLTFSQIFPGCHQGQQTADRVTSCHKNEGKPSLLSHTSSIICKASST